MQVAALAGPQGAPPPRLGARRTCVSEVPLTSDAMLGGSLLFGILGPPGLKNKTGLKISAPGRGSPGRAGSELGHRARPRAACREADVGSAQRERYGPWRLCSARSARPTRPAALTHHVWPRGQSLRQPRVGSLLPRERQPPCSVPASWRRPRRSQAAGKGGRCLRPPTPAVGGAVSRTASG